MNASVNELASLLQDLLGRHLVAYIAGVKDGKTVTRWANAEVTETRQESEQRLRTAYELAQLLIRSDSSRIVRA